MGTEKERARKIIIISLSLTHTHTSSIFTVCVGMCSHGSPNIDFVPSMYVCVPNRPPFFPSQFPYVNRHTMICAS